MRQLHHISLVFFLFFYTNLTAQSTAQKCRINRIEFSDSSFYHFSYDALGRLSQYNYDSDSEKAHSVFQYFYNDKNRISHISMTYNGILMYVCNYTYQNDTFTKRQVAFFKRKIVREEIFHYNEKRQIDRIDFEQSDKDTIIMRFDYNDAGYPTHRVRLSNDYMKNSFADISWDTTKRAINPYETLFEGYSYPISNFFDREISIWTDYPIDFPVNHYICRTRDEFGKQINSNEWIFSDIKTNDQDYIIEMTLTNIIDGKKQTYLQKCFYDNCASATAKK
jgi:hypothetical protein